MSESDKMLLADTWLKDVMPFFSKEPLSFHTAEETQAMLQQRVQKIEASFP